jgi:CheY-like chemotaxis protein
MLLTDLVMPGASGRDLAERIRQHLPDIRVLFMSGYADPELAEAGNSPGAGFLAKPFGAPELLSQVAALLDTGPAVSGS